jgi:hypothetical protein
MRSVLFSMVIVYKFDLIIPKAIYDTPGLSCARPSPVILILGKAAILK